MRPHSNAISRFGLLALTLILPALVHADATQYVGWGNQMLAKSKYYDAAKYFGAAAKMDRRNEAAYSGLGYSYMGIRDLGHATQYLEYALKLNPADMAARQKLGQIYQGYGNQYYQQGNKTLALQWWDKALSVNPNNPQLTAYVANVRSSTIAAAPAPAPAAKPEETVSSTPGVNPWLMGGIVAALGVVMIFAF